MKILIVAMSIVTLTAAIALRNGLGQQSKTTISPVPSPTIRPGTPTSRPTTSPSEPAAQPASERSLIRPEVVLVKHVIGRVNEKTEDEKIRTEAEKLLDEDSLKQIAKSLQGAGDEAHQAENLDQALKEFDKEFAKVKERDLHEWVSGHFGSNANANRNSSGSRNSNANGNRNSDANANANANANSNAVPHNVPWPLCMIKGCR